jgi:hypothetical protein
MSTRPFPLPSDPENGVRKRPADYLFRAGAACVRAFVERSTPERCAKELFGNDVVTPLVLRAASTMATTSSPTWASALAQQAVSDSVIVVASASAAAALIQRGMKIDLDNRVSIKLPGRLLDANDAGHWTAEGAPAVTRAQRMTAGCTLQARKLVVLTSFSREMAEASAIEAVSRALISEATSLALDKSLFGTQADDGTQPAGILNGVTPITATTGGGLAALEGDVKALVAALVAAGAGANPVLVCNPTQATAIKLVASPGFDIPVLTSNSIAAGTVIMIEASSFVSAFGDAPEFTTSKFTTLHYEDSSPQDISGGTPSPATPVRNLFQTDSIALKMRLWAAWGMRAPHCAFVTGATW